VLTSPKAGGAGRIIIKIFWWKVKDEVMEMKLKDLAYLSIKILSIYLVIIGFRQMVNILYISIPSYLLIPGQSYNAWELFFIVGVPAFLTVIAGVLLWFNAFRLALYLVPQNHDDLEISLQTKQLEGFVLAVVGLLLLIFSFSTLVREVLNYMNYLHNDIRFDTQGFLYRVAEQSIRLILSIILLLRAEGFALLLRKIREAGLKHNKPDRDSLK
jgi:hypothetical protein